MRRLADALTVARAALGLPLLIALAAGQARPAIALPRKASLDRDLLARLGARGHGFGNGYL